jgi:hypothetical protein
VLKRILDEVGELQNATKKRWCKKTIKNRLQV